MGYAPRWLAWPLRLLLHFGPVRVCAQLCRSLRARKSHTEVFGIEHVVRSVAMTGDHRDVGRGPTQKLRRDGNLHSFLARLACVCHMCKDADAPLDASLAPPKCPRNIMPPLVKTARR
ncbi:hypothetical protein COCCADRAFT_39527 [Bipolaris zeicola 26-R-13]|uniref:Secreted protein n=1 Tax=Cochliobolus carbonum (strain 26-R-13) TaxID=930089 RepID=W6Y550_COCC2|nr:uncharacterized protein COCCADRAFT_39527 [Bipolaris zeicola 26-R-13]EUC30209.1 hypothetical protein COCCADRAFT_39527 [Bipolaris zeicola 26-R-13]